MRSELNFLVLCSLLVCLFALTVAQWQRRSPVASQQGRWTRYRGQHNHYRPRAQSGRGRSRRMGISLTGPNVCRERGSSFCCPGWSTKGQNGRCLTPICDNARCGSGICQRPNLCLCQNGALQPQCESEPQNEMRCNIRCMNGGKCLNNECRCTRGYTGPFCEQAICGPGCLNGGRCIAPGRCACVYGFTGKKCERDYRKGPCFMTRTNSTCTNEIAGVMCTKLFCCATVGEGWGHPCEECPARVGNCSKGRLPPHCIDINECNIMPGICEGGTCINTDGSFECQCPPGLRYDRTVHRCLDINECEQSHICSNGNCRNTEGSFVCECPDDTRLSSDGSYCISDIPGKCYTVIQSGMCHSPLGDMVSRTMCCCVQSGEETLGKCFAPIGGFPERCAAIGSIEYERDCSGVTPENALCSILGNTACAHGRCVDQPDTRDYYCECDLGYEVTADNHNCMDIDECYTFDSDTRICGADGTCLNTDGSYRCHCNHGFENPPDSSSTCIEIDECVDPNYSNVCHNGRCYNTRGSFRCICNDGYRVTATHQACIDIDECLETQGLCSHGRCINTDGDYRCVCDSGYDLTQSRKECIDTNECERDYICANGECKNLNGTYRCVCYPGFRLLPNGENCADFDECLVNPCMNGRCVNSIGSFRCKCHDYQVLDETGTRCILDESHAQCFRNVRNGQCRAQNALSMSTSRADCCCSVPGARSAWGETCEPCPERTSADFAVLCHDYEIPNICNMLPNACENGDCIRMGNNEYRCQCDVGFVVSEDQRHCQDFDECTRNLCSNGQCRNTPGSYQCTCDSGYLLNGDVCEDIDECISSPCVNGDCINTPGSYRCTCEEGSRLGPGGHICYDVREGRCWTHIDNGQCMDSVGSELMTAEQCCNSLGVAWGSVDCIACTDLEFHCQKGYHFSVERNECVNINECDYDLCDENSDCVDTNGSFICVCPEGFVLLSDGRHCVDRRVGTCYTELDEQGGCLESSAGSRILRKSACCCSIGKGWGDDCEICPAKNTDQYRALCITSTGQRDDNPNECILFPNICVNGVCENTDGGFNCNCNFGYTQIQSGTNCTDIDECVISPGLCGEGACVNTIGDFRCDCNVGYKPSEADKICIDINECFEEAHCRGGNCINTQGSYTCQCPDGSSISEDMSDCVDIDECALNPDRCTPNGKCENLLGHYMCMCDRGYSPTANGLDCVDVDECSTNDGGCHMGCTNTVGSYECSCEEGFVLSFDGHTCADKDECMEQQNRCDGGSCENTVGGFRCICFDGFMSTNDLKFCDDIDECAMNPNVCMNGRCHNTRGSYTCSCNDGYCVPQGQMICVDENECELSKHNCHVNADCNNTDGGYECSCIQGFNGDGFMCHDDNECELNTHMCHEFATCRNKLGGYECDCQEGYHGDGFSCSDNDDCLEDETLCGPHGTCLNVDGSFECDCSMGFIQTQDRKACKDIDECAFEEICVNGRCGNVPGTFKCSCLDGYEKDERGMNCTDIDECLEVANCINGQCLNRAGSYECQCPEGFEPNPSAVGCVDNRIGDCFLHSSGDENAPICTDPIGIGVSKSVCCCSQVAGWGNPCELCPQPNTTEYATLCPGGAGFIPNPITVLLEDIDECRNLPGLCQGGTCINVFGSYVCDCPPGYQLDQGSKACVDVNECELDVDICDAGDCQNTLGGYYCVCPEGYRSILGGRKCEDIRVKSCYRYYNESSGQCSSELFSQTKRGCCCYHNVGQGWNSPCEPCPESGTTEFIDLCGTTGGRNVCKENKDLCRNGVCIPTVDGYTCECRSGYQYNDDLLFCEDINECENDTELCLANAECQNQPGTYRCTCIQGYEFDQVNDACIDINECHDPGTCVNGDCANLPGGFACDCNQGFKEVNDDKACEDINECDRDPCGHGTCQNVFGSFTCTCDRGFKLSANSDCVDVNECDEVGQCGQGNCQNLPGGFACDCDNGYVPTPDGRNCIDENECHTDTTLCGEAGTCQNMDGSYKCFCPEGYSDEGGFNCTDIDECATNEYCAFGVCENSPGSFSCECPPQFKLTSNKKYCVDTRPGKCYDEVLEGFVCTGESSIELTRGGCCCQCNGGGWGFEETNCTACPEQNSTEFNSLCPDGCGFANGIDIDECRSKPCTNGVCMNVASSFKCICSFGYKLDTDGITCININECVENDNVCGHGECVDTEGSFECNCESGFYNGPLMTCLDIDECRVDALNHCGFRCENTLGSFHCACPTGFQLRADGRMCEDVDECRSDSLNDCTAKQMTCKNHVGYYSCLCPSGYRRIGVADNCVDIDECDQLRVCANGQCINMNGTYRCQCNDGYNYDEEHKLCLDMRLGRCYTSTHQRMCEVTSTTGLLFTKAECCCSYGKGWGEDCEECPHPGTEGYLTLCRHGHGFKPNGEDINECKIKPGLCLHGTCINTLGSYRCACEPGYRPSANMKQCIDVDECMATPAPCTTECRNTIGSFECVCGLGYRVNREGTGCEDLNECDTKNHNCQYVCVNTVGSFKCDCPNGFHIEDSTCVDRDECMERPGICGARGICVNDAGSYHCECPRGYRRGMGGACIDLDECTGGQTGCAGNCQNVPGSFRCLCSSGYMPTMYGRGCQDVNECVHNPCGLGQSCTNRRGSFECGCSRGLTKMGSGCGDVDECQMGGGSCKFGCRNTYGGFSCNCPNGYYRINSGHCLRGGRMGFQQRVPHIPRFPGYGGRQGPPPRRGGYGPPPPPPPGARGPQQDVVCYSCMPGGDVPRRQRRSADDVSGRFIEIPNQNGRASVNTTFPLEIHIPASDLNHRMEILSLQTSMKQLRNHSRYEIVRGNAARLFRFRHHDHASVLHFAKRAFAADFARPRVATIRLRAASTLTSAEIPNVSFNSETIRDAIGESVELEVKIVLDDE